MPGDSHLTMTDQLYKDAFVQVLMYQERLQYENHDHFPVFLMGNSLQSLVRARQTSKGHLSNMSSIKHQSVGLEMVPHPNETFFFDSMTREAKQAVFNQATFFNKQSSGLTTANLKSDEKLKSILKTLATFKTSGDSEFIAIAEGKKVPFYVFTYNVEMAQFYYEDPSLTGDKQTLDHSIIAREHA